MKRTIETTSKKYELTDDAIEFEGHTLHRIKAIRDGSSCYSSFTNGDLGGYIEKEDNLSQEGNCWVSDDAKVFGDSQVSENAYVGNNAVIKDAACVYGDSYIDANAVVSEYADVCGYSWISGDSIIKGHATVDGSTWIKGKSIIDGNVYLNFFNRKLFYNVCVFDKKDIFFDKNIGVLFCKMPKGIMAHIGDSRNILTLAAYKRRVASWKYEKKRLAYTTLIEKAENYFNQNRKKEEL